MQYIKELKRLFKHPSKYPMFRITKLRYIFLHILLLSLILIIPNSIQYIQITQNLSTLVNDEVTEIPDFEINQNKMNLSQDKSIKLNHHQTVEFTQSNDFEMKDHHLIVFKPNHIEISNYSDYTEISYGSLSSLVTNQDDLIKFIETINDSKYFYLSLIVVFLLFIQFLSLSIKIGILAFAGHLLGMMLRRKSRFMTWFKMMTFVITLPTLVLLLGMITVIPLLIIASWCIIILSIVMIAMYLPKGKRPAKV
ncbi:DUF1189 domain-containing protein [Mammaliicoccus sciuri]|uniref:DUF1189 family protein n=1 Tax=Mammaliicoccus sciuri TaxID=1296 RepID=UPI001FB551CE|nr:DUF1189 family protein [Mammaliicoccus sciuri]MCJ0919063.1 DUF1189 domain-containing protein [Mammaliicoccus sciuri]MCJ0956762.1 DUF1189 domain-containing protein [Mammaliicoccus sciuri]MCJ0962270.1 DUF1189 domain-containing protein [Mammaliicoccus sciuri]MCJ1775330.1 DUF1189 domain-containing protein [Mammaliicoccus sciuri]MDC5692980.1 DUF1189 domain-containing protein [Mammaliicoccus sciuri]